ncbi:MAG TPA: ABC transporter permease subunit [Streptosporangiaceae bacterium]
MAVIRTFPSGETLRRFRFRPVDALVGAGIFLLIYAVVRIGASARVPIAPSQSAFNTSPAELPYYAARSLLRMFIALFFSYAFSLGYALLAARSRRGRVIMIPALDILQSVPVLGFLTITVSFFLRLFPGSELGLEAAAVFAVFTAQAWNITFSFYHSLTTQSDELDEASRLMGLSRWKRFWAIDVPGGAIGLVWNGMMSFGGSWFFLTASELITVNGKGYTLPGVGSYVGVAEQQGDLNHVLFGIVTMIIMILAVNFVFWRPLVAYVERFRQELTEGSLKPKSLFLDLLHRSSWPGMAGRGRQVLARPVNRVMGAVTGTDDQSLVSHARRRRTGDVVFAVAATCIIGYGVYSLLAYIGAGQGGIGLIWTAFGLGALTLIRVAVVVAVSSVIWVPVGVWIGFNPKVSQYMQPVVQVLASFPANFIFPFVIVFFLDTGISLDYGSVLLMALGTQWYILFNVIAGASAVPSDLKEAMDNLGVRGWKRWQRMIIPAIFPTYITGAITAAGGAWNATIVAEIVPYHGRTLVASGLGSFIAQGSDVSDMRKVIAGILVMAVYVVGLQALLWRRLYNIAERKFALA